MKHPFKENKIFRSSMAFDLDLYVFSIDSVASDEVTMSVGYIRRLDLSFMGRETVTIKSDKYSWYSVVKQEV